MRIPRLGYGETAFTGTVMQFRLSLFTSRAFVVTLLAASGLSISGEALAEVETSWYKPQFEYHAKNRKLHKLLEQFAKAQHLRLTIAPGINGRVSGDVRLPSRQVLDALANEHHFSWRVEGNLLSIEAPAAVNLSLRTSDVQQYVASESPSAETLQAATPMTTWTTTPADKTLQNALARWSLTAGWQLVWELPQDFSIDAAASINGSFEDAVTAMANSLQSSETPITAIFFEGNRVLRIIAKGVQQ